ncbi:MAG TPA: helix-turn-helix domain-containing protein, partial [Acidimicrobiales bacterium]|nr:helix-turn-helix domain-containing protein [Acidimicrobiales bacterium]
SATDLAPGSGVSRQAVVKHLGALESAGVVERRRCGREVRFEVVDGRLDDAARWIADVGRRWDDRLDALRRQVGR